MQGDYWPISLALVGSTWSAVLFTTFLNTCWSVSVQKWSESGKSGQHETTQSANFCMNCNGHSVEAQCVVSLVIWFLLVLWDSGFPHLWESPGVVFVKFPWPGKSWQMCLVLEGPANLTARSYKVVESARPYTMYMVSNCCLSLYFNIAGLWQVLENASGLPQKSGNFCSQVSGNP